LITEWTGLSSPASEAFRILLDFGKNFVDFHSVDF
jgi:hypothetical protein